MTISQLLSNGMKNRLCTHVISPTGCIPLDSPVMSGEHTCQWCGGNQHYSPFVNPSLGKERTVLCGNVHCETYSRTKRAREYQPTTKPSRALEWPLFCEINSIGDLYHDVSFDKVNQSAGKIEYMSKFVKLPKGLIVMQGSPGTGKTYAAMALCEYVTRTESNVIFITQKQLADKWLQTFKEDIQTNFASKVMECKLLVIDDFGTAEMSKSLLEFLMQVINTRLQWSNRGTVITTNLDSKKLSEFCGYALSDRFNTGQKFQFSGKSRRKEIIL